MLATSVKTSTLINFSLDIKLLVALDSRSDYVERRGVKQ